MKEILKTAKTMEYAFLFHNESHEQTFFENHKNEVLQTEGAILFIEYQAKRIVVYPAFNDKNALKRSLGGLYPLLGKNETIYIEMGESHKNEGILESIHNTFIDLGCVLVSENLAMRLKKISIKRPFITDNVKKFNSDTKALYNLSNDLLSRELFNMTFEEFEAMLNSDEYIILTIEDSEDIKGFIYGQIYNDGKSLFLRGLGVHESFQGMGLSKKLIQGLFEHANQKGIKDSMLWVDAMNHKAIKLYKQFDYRFDGDKERLYTYRVR